MARPRKTGLDYFPVDCQFDEKVEMLEVAHGNDGLAVLIKAWQTIYRTEKGELDISSVLLRKTLAERTHITEERWSEIVKTCAEIGLFTYSAWEKNLLTSNGIKKRLGIIEKERQAARDRSKSSSANNPRKTGEKEKERESSTGERESDPRARAGSAGGGDPPIGTEQIYDPQIRPPTLEEAVEYAVSRDLDGTVAADVWEWLTSIAWIDKDGRPMRHWRFALMNAIRGREVTSKPLKKVGGSNGGANSSAGQASPLSQYRRRSDLTGDEVRSSRDEWLAGQDAAGHRSSP